MRYWIVGILLAWACGIPARGEIKVVDGENEIRIETSAVSAVIRKKGYVTGVAGGTFVDRKTGFADAGFGLDVVDWIMEGGSDEAYRDQLPKEMVYLFNNAYHGKTAKRSIEGPQICTQAKELSPVVIRGKDFAAVKQSFTYRSASPGKKAGSVWEQTIVFPEGKRYFISSDKITSVNDGDGPFLRVDMPGHIKHKNGDTFSEVYLSYFGKIPSAEFAKDFAPDEKFSYARGREKMPERFIRAYHLRDPKTGMDGPWLAGMTLKSDVVSEAWCHQRGYVCFIEEFGGRPIKAGEAFGAAFVVGYFESVEEMDGVCDQFRGSAALSASAEGYRLLP